VRADALRRRGAGGNCYDFIGDHGIRISQYGVHLFHTQARGCSEKAQPAPARVASARWLAPPLLCAR
jgi:hypothetical protein